MQSGFSFVWKAGKRPYWLTPWGTVVPLVVDNLIPYLVVGSTQCRPRAVLPEHLQIPQPRDIASGKVAMGTPPKSRDAVKEPPAALSLEKALFGQEDSVDPNTPGTEGGPETTIETKTEWRAVTMH